MPDEPAAPSTPPPEPDAAPPPAAETVASGELSESSAGELVRVREELESALKKVRDRETRVSELEDENHTLRSSQVAPSRRAPAAKDWFNEL